MSSEVKPVIISNYLLLDCYLVSIDSNCNFHFCTTTYGVLQGSFQGTLLFSYCISTNLRLASNKRCPLIHTAFYAIDFKFTPLSNIYAEAHIVVFAREIGKIQNTTKLPSLFFQLYQYHK